MITRKATYEIKKQMQIFPAVAILGSRQCGKSTLVKMMSHDFPNLLYIDLQNRMQRMQLHDPVLFFQHNRNCTICLDEVQLIPELFDYLRSEIDADRRNGRFILLGSASRKLLQHTTESLAGRIGLIDLTPFSINEVAPYHEYTIDKFWFRGGYPDSYLAPNDDFSAIWRENYLRTYIEHDIPQLAFQIAAPTMMRLITMLAHEHGAILNNSKLSSAMGLSSPTIRHYIDILEATYILRILPPYFVNIKKRLTKTPRIYFRDSGLLHQILGIKDFNHLLGHSVVGMSWEGMVIENICSAVKGAKFSFHRSANGSEEMDLVVEYPDHLIAIECKSSTEPQVTDGFYRAIETLKPTHTYIVCPINNEYPFAEGVTVTGLLPLVEKLVSCQ